MVAQLAPANREMLGFRLGIPQNDMPVAEHIERLGSNLIAIQREDEIMCAYTYRNRLPFPYVHAAINALVEKLLLSPNQAASGRALYEELALHTMAEILQSVFEEAYGL